MKIRASGQEQTVDGHCELLILPDGRVLAHNLTAATARVLARLNPHDRAMGRRAKPKRNLPA